MTMARRFRAGERVKSKWREGWGSGDVKERFTEDVTITIDSTDVMRTASDDEPVYRIEQDDGDQVLESHCEIQSAD